MPDLEFTQAEPRSFIVPIVGAMLVLAACAGLYTLKNPGSVLKVAAAQTSVIATSTVYKTDTIVLGPQHTETVLFVVPVLTFENHQKTPATFESATLTITDPTGAELTTHAVSQADIENAARSFPQIQSSVAGAHLVPDQVVAAGARASGCLLFGVQVPRSVWDTRKSAVVHVSLFHQAGIDVPLK